MKDETKKNTEVVEKAPIDWEALSSDEDGDQEAPEGYEHFAEAPKSNTYYEKKSDAQYPEREYNND
jgi:hypothetical protein